MLLGTLFLVVLLAELTLLSTLVYSIRKPENGLWPPRNKFTFWINWTNKAVIYSVLFVLTILGWNNFVLPDWMRYVLGPLFLIIGTYFSLSSVRILGKERTVGKERGLCSQGIYSYTRNPQYIFFILSIIGYTIVVNSIYVFTCAFILILWYLLAPLAEEPWLKKKYGKEYLEYKEKVPRWI